MAEYRDERVLRRIANSEQGVLTFSELAKWFAQAEPDLGADAGEALKRSLLRLKFKQKVSRTADTWSLVGAGTAVAHA